MYSESMDSKVGNATMDCNAIYVKKLDFLQEILTIPVIFTITIFLQLTKNIVAQVCNIS